MSDGSHRQPLPSTSSGISNFTDGSPRQPLSSGIGNLAGGSSRQPLPSTSGGISNFTNEFSRLYSSASPSRSNAPANNLIRHQRPTQNMQHNNALPQPTNLSPNYNWQASKDTLKDRMEFIYNTEILSDVHFVVGRSEMAQRIPAHKFVLCIGSAVFNAMFNSPLASESDNIELPDIEPSAFLDLLKYLYLDDVKIDAENVMTTLYTAKKYAVPALETCCVEFLERNLSPDNAFLLLTQARLFDEADLATLCLRTIDKSTSDAVTADGFTDIDLDTLCSVLQRSSLRVKETKIFQAVIRWSEAECSRRGFAITASNKRLVLDRAIYLIRFPLMTIEEFANGPAQSKILTDTEVVSLFLYYTIKPKPLIAFNDTPRSSMSGHEFIAHRFHQMETRWGYSGTCDRIRFMVDATIYIVGFGLYGGICVPSEYTVLIEIIHTSTGNILAKNDIAFNCDGSNIIYRAMFTEPVQICADTNYTASAMMKGPDSYYGTRGMRKVFVDTEIGRVTFQFSYSAGNNNGTSVEDGQIPQILFYT